MAQNIYGQTVGGLLYDAGADAYGYGLGLLDFIRRRPESAGLVAGQFVPGAATADFYGRYPDPMNPSQMLPSAGQNLAQGNILDAAFQGVGLLGDAFYAASPFTAGAAAVPGAVLSAPRAAQLAKRGSKGIEERLIEKYPGIDIDIYEQDKGLTLSKIVVPKELRSQGLGTKVLNDLVEYADQTGKRVALTPDTSFGGTSKKRLESFYRRFGFVPNKGRNKDFEFKESMIRQPEEPDLTAASVASELSPAEEMAKKVTDLLKSGKADEVTEEMLEKADPAYLAKNYDLPMDAESRMARAREMGFDVDNVMYHGTNNQPYAKVNVDMGASDRYKTGFYTTDNPDVADTYASKTSGGSIMPVVMRRSPDMVVDAQGANWNRLEYDLPAYAPEAGDEDLYFYFNNIFSDNALEPISTNTIARQRRFEGDDAVLFENLVDRGGSPPTGSGIGLGGDTSSASNPSNVRVDFYPNSIRSKFARFDPRLKDLGNLNAGVAVPVLSSGVLAGLLAEERLRQDEELVPIF